MLHVGYDDGWRRDIVFSISFIYMFSISTVQQRFTCVCAHGNQSIHAHRVRRFTEVEIFEEYRLHVVFKHKLTQSQWKNDKREFN